MMCFLRPKRLLLAVTCICIAGAIGAPVATAAVDWIGVPEDPSVPLAFEDPENWDPVDDYDPVPPPGQETAPPGPDSIFFIGGPIETDDEPPQVLFDHSVTIELTEERSGNNGTMPFGTMAIGNGSADQVQTLIISNDVTFNGRERESDGTVVPTELRGLRVGREDTTLGDGNFPWGVVRQTAGKVLLDFPEDPSAASIKLSGDNKEPNGAAGSIWEVGGTASLSLPDAVFVGGFRIQPESPGSIFRVRGSGAGPIEIGNDQSVETSGGDFVINSQGGLWDTDKPAEFGGRTRYNRGKSIAEFVLDADGVTPIEARDEVRIGQFLPSFISPTGADEFSLGFLRVKLSEPTTAGSGAPGSDDEIVLFRADRLVGGGIETGTELDNGRFFDPDRITDTGDPNTSAPHRFLFDGGTVIADYAGATYEWAINYQEASTEDDVVEDAVTLTDLAITGTPGDLNGDTLLDAGDREALEMAIASPPEIGLGEAQNLYDLNADDVVNELDLQHFNEVFLPPAMLAGDYNDDGVIDAGDYVAWRDNLGAPAGTLPNDPHAEAIGALQYDTWRSNYGDANGAPASGAPAPEPAAALLLALAAAGVATRRGAGR